MSTPNIQVVSASAGSGKTYRLAEILLEELGSGGTDPEAVLAVTFTRKAAAELRERARQFLLKKGRFEDAQRLGAGRFGTVNGVCGRLVSDFSFALGLSPQQSTLDELASSAAVNQALATVLNPLREARLRELAETMFNLDWQRDTRRIIELARVNLMDGTALRDSADRSVQTFSELLGPPERSGSAIEEALQEGLENFVAQADSEDKTRATTEGLDRAHEALALLRRGVRLRWDSWARFAALSPGKKSRVAAGPLVAAASRVYRHPDFQQDLTDTTTILFELAADGLGAYQSIKREWGAVDFVDQETKALEALELPVVREQLRSELDLVLVDEFQDTSPLQLKIFLQLAELARKSVWVGDQKQAIFGFRGTDPALMDAAIEAILQGAEPETLPKSWRSRPPLVDVTSDVFAAAFEHRGIPPSRTRLKAAIEEPPGLGPPLERWRITGTATIAEDISALASGVEGLLADEGVLVRGDEGPRQIQPKDVAILCRTNRTCRRLARALEELSIPNVLSDNQLLATPEAQMVVAGLRRWADPRDRLAAATMARFSYPDEWANAWLASALKDELGEHPAVVALDGARGASPTASTLEAFDRIVVALDLHEMTLAWGASEKRRGNLDALRAHAVSYVESARTSGSGSSPGSLANWLESLYAIGLDDQAALPGQDAVTICTRHAAKGLEWPVAILFSPERRFHESALGLHVMVDGDEFSFDEPLANRWLRLWPNPFFPGRSRTWLHERIAQQPATARLAAKRAHEELRLLYVAWTRARDRVAVVSRAGADISKVLDGLVDDENRPLVTEPEDGKAIWLGAEVDFGERGMSPPAADPPPLVAGTGYVASGAASHPPALIRASEISRAGGVVGGPIEIGPRVKISGAPNMAVVGDAVHLFLAADRPSEMTAHDRQALATRILSNWGLQGQLVAADLVAASDRLGVWAEGVAPGAVCRREWPLSSVDEKGTRLVGAADLVLESPTRLVVVDHKTFPGGTEEAENRVRAYVGQVWAYASVLAAATGARSIAQYVHLPVSGLVFEVRAD